jgi:hypothetical protein
MYHVTADNAFPYRLCGGQQDSGSACVASRGMDGEITFHDWHPVAIEEYGMAAPDPKNPDLVYGGKVSLYNRATGQKTSIGPPRPGRGAPAPIVPGEPSARTVRTQPLQYSLLRHRRRLEDHQRRPQLDTYQRRPHPPILGRAW